MILFNGTVENTFGYKWFADIMKVVLVFLIIFPDIVKKLRHKSFVILSKPSLYFYIMLLKVHV